MVGSTPPYPRSVGEHLPISYDQDGHGAAIVRVNGDLDLATGDDVVQAVAVALVGHTRSGAAEAEVQLDLSGVSFIDCAGLSALLRARRSAASHGWAVRVVAMSPEVRQLLDLSGTLELLSAPALPDPA